MSSSSSRAVALAFAAGAASGLLLSTLVVQALRAKGKGPRTIAAGINSSGSSNSKGTAAAVSLPPEIERELFARVMSFFGEEAFQGIKDAFVIVVGLGGVGSHAAHMLARSGVGRLRVIDFDQVTLSSLNRHAVARLADVGLPKADVLRDRLAEIVPSCRVEAVRAMMKAEDAATLLSGSPTFVLDCIDDVATKAELLGYCQAHGLRVICSLGAGLKADPTRLHIGELDNTKNEPLAIKLRFMLRKKGHSAANIATVYSHEQPRGELLPLTAEQETNPKEFGLLENFRLRVLPVLGTTPAIFGQAMAAYVLCELAGQPILPVAVHGLSRGVKHRLLQHLRNRERKNYDNPCNDISMDDVDEVAQEIWRQRCCATGDKIGTGCVFALTRWDRSRRPAVDNLVLFNSAAMADRFDEEGPSMLSPEARRKVEERLRLFRNSN